VTLAEVIDAIEGPIAAVPGVPCAEVTEEVIGSEVLGAIWTGVSAEARIRLGEISIEDIVQRTSGSVSPPVLDRSTERRAG
jgi:DNA-binding IscR family transcriptional regulator